MIQFAEDDPPAPKQAPAESFHTDLTVGEILRRSRTQLGITFKQAERDIHIKAQYLESLEHNSLERLPGRVYVIGFVRAYSEYLGLDGEKMVSLLKKQGGRRVEKVRHKLTRPVIEDEEEEQKGPGWTVIAGSAFALISAMVLIGVYTSSRSPEEIPAVPKELKAQMTAPQKPAIQPQQVAATTEEAQTEAIAPATPAAPAAHPIVLKALQNTWLEIRDPSRNVVFSRVLNQGEEYWVPADQPTLYMTLGNAGGLQILVEGQALPLLGAVGQVKKNVLLDVAALKASLAPAAKTKPR